MNIFFIPLLGFMLLTTTGCLSVLSLNESYSGKQATNEINDELTIPDLNNPKAKLSNIFTYQYAQGLPQVQAIVRGSFIQKGNCLLLKYIDDLYSPILPYGVSSWNAKESKLMIFGEIIPLEKSFSTNGAYGEYSEQLLRTDSIVTYPSDECIEKKNAMIGTEGFLTSY